MRFRLPADLLADTQAAGFGTARVPSGRRRCPTVACCERNGVLNGKVYEKIRQRATEPQLAVAPSARLKNQHIERALKQLDSIPVGFALGHR